ncbi:MAG: hypothetical protein ACLPND_13605 [Candidatus Korobacteraceae bacterium]
MPGTLHIFRLKSDPLQYQVNYNLSATSWVQVFDAPGLEEFLLHSACLPVNEEDALLQELRSSGHATKANVDLPESHLGEMGFAKSPSDE